MPSLWQDPVSYVLDWVLTLPLQAIDSSETEYLKFGIACHAALLYSFPLSKGWSKRRVFAFVRRALARYEDDLLNKGVIESIVSYDDCAMLFLKSFDKEGGGTFTLPVELLDTPIGDAVKLFNKHFNSSDHVDVETQRWISTWLQHLSKIPLSRPDLRGPAIEAWVATQNEVINREFVPDETTECLRRVAGWLLELGELPDTGKHGPGITYSGARDVDTKNRHYMPNIYTVQLTDRHPVLVTSPLSLKRDPSKGYLVTKSVKSLRFIAAEAVAMQYAQQGLKRIMYASTDDMPELQNPISKFVRYKDQSRARALAVIGSKQRSSDATPVTIDLKEASNRLSLSLVKAVFKGPLLDKLLAGRSTEVEIDGESFPIGMYAGMGSALTFPVQTTIFTSMAVLSTVIALHEKLWGIAPHDLIEVLPMYLDSTGFRKEYTAYANAIQVYGDDIIVPELAAPHLIQMLESCGLKVNTDKSFIGQLAVRESCGIFACWGQDITPLRFRPPLWKNNGSLDTAAYEGLRSLVNLSYHYNFRVLYRLLLRKLKSTPLFVNKEERQRRFTKPVFDEILNLETGVSKQVPIYPKQELGEAKLLFEEYRGDDNYIGFVSDVGTSLTHTIQLWDRVKAVTTWGMEVEKDSSTESEFYYYQQDMRSRDLLTDSANSKISIELVKSGYATFLQSRSHGNIPRGTRLRKFNAIQVPVKGSPANYKNRPKEVGVAPGMKNQGLAVRGLGWAPR